MRLRKFDRFIFNFWKEQLQEYLIVNGQIDPIETQNIPEVFIGRGWSQEWHHPPPKGVLA